MFIAHPGHEKNLAAPLHLCFESCYTGIACPPRDLLNESKF
jgi:hypothetical protein